MTIEFLRVTPEEAIRQLRSLIEEGYQIYNSIKQEYLTLSDEHARITKIPEWQTQVNTYYQQCSHQLTSIYTSSLYWDELADVEIMDAEFGEIKAFTEIRRFLRARIQILRKNYDFIIQHSNARFTIEGNLQLNITAGRDINNAPNGEINTNNDTD
jgi:hypothetical protein